MVVAGGKGSERASEDCGTKCAVSESESESESESLLVSRATAYLSKMEREGLQCSAVQCSAVPLLSSSCVGTGRDPSLASLSWCACTCTCTCTRTRAILLVGFPFFLPLARRSRSCSRSAGSSRLTPRLALKNKALSPFPVRSKSTGGATTSFLLW